MKNLLFVCSFIVIALADARSGEVTVYAAESLSAPLKELAADFHTGGKDQLKLVFGSSDQLAKSLKEGAQGDVFFSSSDKTMDALETAKLLSGHSRLEVLSNALVIVVPKGADGASPPVAIDLTSAGIKKLGLVRPEFAPVGVYAKKYLENAKIWEHVKDKVVSFENTTTLLAAGEASQIDAAIVFRTEALLSGKFQIVTAVSPDEGPSISYALALMSSSKQPDPSSEAVIYLSSPAAAKVFEKYGFVAIPKPSQEAK